MAKSCQGNTRVPRDHLCAVRFGSRCSFEVSHGLSATVASIVPPRGECDATHVALGGLTARYIADGRSKDGRNFLRVGRATSRRSNCDSRGYTEDARAPMQTIEW